MSVVVSKIVNKTNILLNCWQFLQLIPIRTALMAKISNHKQ